MKKINYLNNNGSSVISVILIMFFVTILGTSAMILALGNFNNSVTEYQGRLNYYSASSLMYETRAYIVNEVSDSIEATYNEILENYDKYITADTTFEQVFTRQLMNELYKNSDLFENVSGMGGLAYNLNQTTIKNAIPELKNHTLGLTGGVYRDDANNTLHILDVSIRLSSNTNAAAVYADILIHTDIHNYTVDDEIDFDSLVEFDNWSKVYDKK